MIIGVDGNEANVKEKVGVSVYTYKLLEYFQKNSTQDSRFIVFLRDYPNLDLPDETEYFKYQVVPGSFLWSQLFLPMALIQNRFSKNHIDVFFSPAHYAPRYCPCPCITTIHDLSFFKYPHEFLKKDLYQLTHWTAYSINKSIQVIAVSKTTKKDILEYYKIPEKKIKVVYNGFEKSPPSEGNKQVLNDINVESKRYVLYVGTIQPRKNITTLLRAYGSYYKTNPDIKLVIVGKKGWLFDEILAEAKDLYLKDNIIFTGYLEDEELETLYKNALFFVLPSLYEGFGIPLLEAMSNDCPVISSYAASLPEIGGEACLYFDPTSESELLEKMEVLTHDKKLQDELIQKGKERLADFSWIKCGKQTLEVLRSSISSYQLPSTNNQ